MKNRGDKGHFKKHSDSMGKGGMPLAPTPRSKREDCHRTKHDSNFSKWQVLIGPTDWEDYSLGKEGVARYRVHNLPSSSSPGLYELGISVTRPGLGRETGKLDPGGVVVVYLGQADNVRARLQRYGRSGAHLANSCSTGCPDDPTPQKGTGLFEEIFSMGYSIVFRWTPMKTKRDAEKAEGQLLDTFDYGWNKGRNGSRRCDDILQKLCEIGSSTSKLSTLYRRLLPYTQKHVGITIEGKKPLSSEKKSGAYADEEDNNFFRGIFTFSKSRPRLVSRNFGNIEDLFTICGVILNDGTPCRRPPVAGRKRCEDHKGKRIYGYSFESAVAGQSRHVHDVNLGSSLCNYNTACGVNLGDGSFCGRQPFAGRKRCEEHKGMSVNGFVSKPATVDKFELPSISLGDNDISWTACGATLANGSFCSRQPVQGNKRCWQHKGKRVDFSLSNMDSTIFRSATPMSFNTCGVTLQNGSVCMRAPVRGRKRCEQHKGMRVTTS
ncbi:hypothetical protein CFOL_v3_11808 [Cephalotus follicularis]|uniref:Protein EFFECTOR OF TRANSCRIPTION 2-like n=1 Tax=Cephalotus follicularis TaxID=3775 RepID=A0A1Q3BK10_CEPFO|nr:hypothetical protein CFOL_v3_11808 [Cephalotus follicularis]